MTQYIDKSILLAEIDDKINILEKNSGYTGIFGDAQLAAYNNMKKFISTLKVKEVDLDEEIDSYFNTSIRKNIQANDNVTLFMQVRKTAKRFFELGLKLQKGE